MTNKVKLSYCGNDVQRLDNDRFICALFAPDDRREALYALYAFNCEVARVREAVTEPLLGQIRLQWWRDVFDGIYGDANVPGHPIAEPLAAAIRTYDLPHRLFEQLLDARVFDLEPQAPDNMGALLSYVDATSTGLVELALRILLHGKVQVDDNVEITAAAQAVGRHWGLVGLMRAVPYHAGFGKSFIPRDFLRRHKLDHSSAPSPALSAAVIDVVAEAKRQFNVMEGVARAVPRAGLSALLPVVLSQRYIKQFTKTGHNPYDMRIARRGGIGHHLSLLYANAIRRV